MQANPNSNLNTGYPGFCYNFDASDQTCEVQLAIETLTIGLDQSYKVNPKERLLRVPVHFARGDGWALTFPIPDGTPCYVHFAQRGIDHWLLEGKAEAGLKDGYPDPAFRQYHHHNSAVAFVGVNPVTSAIGNFATDGMELRNAGHNQIVSLKGDGTINIITGSTTIKIEASGAITMTSPNQITAKAPAITLDGDVTITKSLNVQGGGDSSSQISITGKMDITGPINNVQIESHQHPYDWTDGDGNSNTQAPIPV